MTAFDVAISPAVDFEKIERAVDDACLGSGLTVHSKSTLRQYPGCVHWHIRKGKLTGTLEITLWPQIGRLWFVVHENRKATWIDDVLPVLRAHMQGRFENSG
jgi:hypothetical protein